MHEARDAALVPGAPRLDAAADPRFLFAPELVELAPRHRLGSELDFLAALEIGVIAGIAAQQPAVELDDARGEAVEEGAIVGDDDRRGLLHEQGLEPGDAVDIQMVGRLVEQQELGLEREREGERRALHLPARGGGGIEVLVHLETVQVLGEARLETPSFAIILKMSMDRRHGSQEQARVQRRRVQQLRLLLHQRHGKAVALFQFAVIERRRAGDDAEERGLAGAVAADQPDALARLHRERSTVEERQFAESELSVSESQERHGN